MLLSFFLTHIFAASLFATTAIPAYIQETPAPAIKTAPQPPALTRTLSKAKSLYYEGNLSQAVKIYQRALKTAPRLIEAWLNGAVILEELGKSDVAMNWYAKAAAINPKAEIETALGWCDFRIRRFNAAKQAFNRALSENPQNPYALLGMAKINLAQRNLSQAIFYLKRAAAADPFFTLIPFYEGKVYEQARNLKEEIKFYRQAAMADSYFLEAREALGRAYLKQGSYSDALAQFRRIQRSEPKNRVWNAILKSIPQINQEGFSIQPSKLYHWLMPLLAAPLPSDGVPILRIGIGTNPMGRPRQRSSIAFYVTSPFDIVNSKGKILASGSANQIWVVNLKKRFLFISGPPHVLIKDSSPLIINPKSQEAMVKMESPSDSEEPGLARVLRGKIEFAVFKKNLRIVNIVDLENYTQGVLASEMPIRSPIEALKAQAVLARSEALFLKTIWRRHKKQGYDLCDGEHCQVYGGVRSESRLARSVVEETRSEVITFKGHLAHGIYSANCGGHTQSSEEVSGWGKVSYWKGIPDGGPPRTWPLSPWKLENWLTTWPDAFCQPSSKIYPSHYRWNRVIPIKNLSLKISKRLRIGRLKSVIPLKRAFSGNVNSVLFIGTQRRVIIRDELKIRSLLGIGSLRSTLFTLNTEYDSKGHPEFLIFHGGGWGHGVGMCQSGAMGRAAAGQNYKDIIKAYFPGVEINRLDYLRHK
jgi:SpoIID/LytB domain protein